MGARSSQSRGPGLNKTDGHLIEYLRNNFGAGGGGTNAPGGDTFHVATGGVISDYTIGTDVYRAHIFTSSGTFDVTEVGTADSGGVEYMVIGGGGGGGEDQPGNRGGGGGAGGYRTNVPTSIAPPLHNTGASFPVAVATYPVIIGAGANPPGAEADYGGNGSDSSFGPPSAPARIISTGGGGGGGNFAGSNSKNPGRPGGSGGGGGASTNATNAYAGGSTTAVTTPSPWPGPATQGHAGGQGYHASGQWASGGGGGGAGAVGREGTDANAGDGGIGIQNLIAGPASEGYGGIGAPGPGGATSGWFCGGGGGLAHNGNNGTGGTYNGSSNVSGGPYAGGAAGHLSVPNVPGAGTVNTGGGGGAGNTELGRGRGGSGIVVVRYRLAEVAANTAAASGGSVSFYTCPASSIIGAGNKTIHTFTASGEFTTPGTFGTRTCEFFVVGGGGSGFTGGGGAGGVRHGTIPVGNNATIAVTVGAGAPGNSSAPIGSPSKFGPSYSVNGGGSGGGPWNSYAANPGVSGAGGSQGGGGNPGGSETGANYPGNSDDASPAAGWGYGGRPSPGGDLAGGGGGGAGGLGTPQSQGGPGVQLPSTLRDPNGFQYDKYPDHPYRPSSAPGWWVGGGGSGTVYTPGPQPYTSDYTGMGGRGGGGSRNPADPRYPYYGFNGMANTGGGGCGGSPINTAGFGSSGGSGVVIVAYPT